jgi:antitoxin (DNA-binding transcriptional repressor) of toxin-antitoxin stability system
MSVCRLDLATDEAEKPSQKNRGSRFPSACGKVQNLSSICGSHGVNYRLKAYKKRCDSVMKTLELNKPTASLAEYAREIDKEPVIVTSDGKPLAALVAVENADLETVTISVDPQFLALIERSRARQKAEGGISATKMRRRLGAKPKTQASVRKLKVYFPYGRACWPGQENHNETSASFRS